MFNRKHRKSAVALMMVAGGLAAVVPASDLVLAQKPDTPSATQSPATAPPGGFKPQGTTGVPAVMPQGTTGLPAVQPPARTALQYKIIGNKLYVIDAAGKDSAAPDGRYPVQVDALHIIVRRGIITDIRASR